MDNAFYFLAVFWILYIFVLIPLLVMLIIAEVRMFKKAGQPGWAAIVPGYGMYVQYKIARLKKPLLHTIVVCVYMTAVVSVLTAASIIAALKSGRRYEPMKLFIYTYIFELPLVVLNFISSIKLSKSFGHGAGFGIGLCLLPYLFSPILGFGKSRYIYGVEKKNGSDRTGSVIEFTGGNPQELPGSAAEDGFCTYCGTFMKAGIRFCPNCGKKNSGIIK